MAKQEYFVDIYHSKRLGDYEVKVEWYIEQDICDRCYPILVRELFDRENNELTCKEFIKKMRRT